MASSQNSLGDWSEPLELAPAAGTRGGLKMAAHVSMAPAGQAMLFHQVAGLLPPPHLESCGTDFCGVKGSLMESVAMREATVCQGLTMAFVLCALCQDYFKRILTNWRMDAIGGKYVFR